MTRTDGNRANNEDREGASTYTPLLAQFEACDNWQVCQSRIDKFFVAYNITKMERMRTILLTSLAMDVYVELMKLCFPEAPESKTLKELCIGRTCPIFQNQPT